MGAAPQPPDGAGEDLVLRLHPTAARLVGAREHVGDVFDEHVRRIHDGLATRRLTLARRQGAVTGRATTETGRRTGRS